jgi:hypothetical protein
MSILMAAGASGDPLLDYLSQAGAVAILAAGVIGFLRGWIVPGRRYDEIKAERDRAVAVADRHAEIADRALSVLVEAALDKKRDGGGV